MKCSWTLRFFVILNFLAFIGAAIYCLTAIIHIIIYNFDYFSIIIFILFLVGLIFYLKYYLNVILKIEIDNDKLIFHSIFKQFTIGKEDVIIITDDKTFLKLILKNNLKDKKILIIKMGYSLDQIQAIKGFIYGW